MVNEKYFQVWSNFTMKQIWWNAKNIFCKVFYGKYNYADSFPWCHPYIIMLCLVEPNRREEKGKEQGKREWENTYIHTYIHIYIYIFKCKEKKRRNDSAIWFVKKKGSEMMHFYIDWTICLIK